MAGLSAIVGNSPTEPDSGVGRDVLAVKALGLDLYCPHKGKATVLNIASWIPESSQPALQ